MQNIQNIANRFEILRSQFPSLKRSLNGKRVVFLDGPAGTQVPQPVINAISNYYEKSNSNTHGFFRNTKETDAIIEEAREWSASFLGAAGSQTISFGQNMTTLAYFLSYGFGRILKKGDEVLITQLDHEANRGPWLVLQEKGINVIEVDLQPTGTLDMSDFERKITKKTKLVAIGCASNVLGTINDFKKVRDWTKAIDAKLVLDAVHYAPHFPINVKEMDCDFLFCSAYKFYGPHIGILYSKPGELDALSIDSLRTQDQISPYKIETGTLNHAALAGITAAIQFIGSIVGPDKKAIHDAMHILAAHEKKLLEKFYAGLETIDQVKIQGPGLDHPRTPTISFTHEKYRPEEICQKLGDNGVFAWDGHFYAIRPIEVLGLLERGGVTRLGISVYTTEEDIDLALDEIRKL